VAATSCSISASCTGAKFAANMALLEEVQSMRRAVVAVLVALIFPALASAKTNSQSKLFNEAFGRTISYYITEPKAADLVRGAVEGMIKFAPNSPAVAFARSKLVNLPESKNGAVATFNAIFDNFKSSGSPPPDEAALLDAAISGMLMSLDPHSNYLN